MTNWAAVEEQAQKQHGLINRKQLLELGSKAAFDHAVASGRVVKTDFRSVYRLAGISMEDWRVKASAAQLRLAPGSALSHTTAATIWGLDGFGRVVPTVFHVTAPRGRECVDDRIRLHLTNDGAAPSVVHKNLVVTTVPRTLLDLASCVRERDLEAALDSARRIHEFSAEELNAQLDEIGRGKDGTALLRLLIAKRKDPLDSRLEVFIARELLRRGITGAIEHFVARDAMGRIIMEIDFAWPGRLIALHGDSYEFHTNKQAFEDDLAKRARLAAAGWTNISVGWNTWRQHDWSNALKRLLHPAPSC